MFKYPVVLLLLLSLSDAYGQNNSLIIQQYRRGERMGAPYRTLNFELEAHLVRMQLMKTYTSPKTDFNVGARMQFRFTKTFGVTAGVNYLNLSYQYQNREYRPWDRATYLSVPFTLRLFIGEKIHVETGGLYNKTLSLSQTKTIDGQRSVFNVPPESAGENLGMLLGLHFRLFRATGLSVQYRFAKRISYPGQSINNNIHGILIGMQCALRRNSSTRKVPLDLGIQKR